MRCHHSVKQCALRARSTHDVHHAIVSVNVVIGVLVVHCELHVVVRVHVPLVVVCDEAVVRRTLGLIALVFIVVFVVAMFNRILLYGRYTLYRSCNIFTHSVDVSEPVAWRPRWTVSHFLSAFQATHVARVLLFFVVLVGGQPCGSLK